jgi:hypothetical protein
MPLNERDHFLQLGAAGTINGDLAASRQYEDIPALLEEFLADSGLWQRIRMNNRRYFDEFLCPQAVGEYICRQVAASSDAPAGKEVT